MKQHPDHIGGDLDDEVAAAIEHQYARRLMKSAAPQKSAAEARQAKADKDNFDDEIEQIREKSGF